jgi:hypothetical protein
MTAERLFHLISLMEPEQPVINENAGEPITDGPVYQHGGNR